MFRISLDRPIRLSPDPLEEEVLRIDETSKTLVAPQAGGLVTEASPDREELLALVGASWEAFAQELGLPSLKLLATEPLPGIDMLAFDQEAGRAVVVQVTGETPQLVVVAGAYDPSALATAGWLSRRHGLDISTYAVSVLRFGNERLLSVRREPRDGQSPDPASEVQWMLTGTSPEQAAAPAPPAVPA